MYTSSRYETSFGPYDIRVEYPNGTVEQYEYNFRWSWENYAQTSIRMSYGPNDVTYLDDVYIGGNRLSGYLDGRKTLWSFRGNDER